MNMKLVVISHKPCWKDPSSPTGYAANGGFPMQMEALSELFEKTELYIPIQPGQKPSGTQPLTGHNLSVRGLAMPAGSGWGRKLSWLGWLPRSLPFLWRAARSADAVHAPIPGDIGTFGILVSLLLGKRLFVRYCGIWGVVRRPSHRFAFWLLERIAGGRNVVLATGGGEDPPSRKNPAVRWIFATSLREAEMEVIPDRNPWRKGSPPRLITVARQEAGKNSDQIIRALPTIQRHYPAASLDVVGSGSQLPGLEALAEELCVSDQVIFHGQLDHDEVISRLLEADIFCFPSDSEGFPKAVHEALACGLAVVASPVSVLPHLIGDKNGVLLPDRRPETIARAVLELIGDEHRMQEISRNARCTAREYSLERWRDEIGRILSASWEGFSTRKRDSS
jgi:glycosyltransferase involved in cell wall biosynthesis